jgi:hypothetical protein
VAASISLSNFNIILDHGSVPFTVPPNLLIKNRTTLKCSFKVTWSGLWSGTKDHYFTWSAEEKDKVWPYWYLNQFTDDFSSTSTSGSRTITINLMITDELAAKPPGLLPGSVITLFPESSSDTNMYRIYLSWDKEVSVTLPSSDYTFVEWAEPQIDSYSVYRADPVTGLPNDAGTKIRYSLSAQTTPLTGYGYTSFMIRYKKPSDSTWTEVELESTGNSINDTDVELDGDFPLNESYVFQLIAYDGYVSAIAQTEIFAGRMTLHLNASGDGIGLGKYSEGPGLDVGWDARFRGNVQFDNPAAARGALGISAMTLGFNASTGTFPGGSGSTDADNAIAPFDKVIASKGGGLTFDAENHGVVIGPGISHVEASGQAFFYDGFTDNVTRMTVIALDGITVQEGRARTSGTPYMCISVPPVIVPVSEGQVITLGCRSNSGNAGKIDIRHTYLTVKVV